MVAGKRIPLPSSRPHKRKATYLEDSSPPLQEPVHSTPEKRKRGKTKAITSCERCRHAHIKCVSRGPGEPCENCAKRSTCTCSFTREQPSNEAAMNQKPGQEETREDSLQAQELRIVAATVLAYLEKQLCQPRSIVGSIKSSSTPM
ncbi:hypothetical protein F4805DRAFT_455156 [Annulohypoxylon moriforme]|nr:hypothetical protein F4805DRAFT_455156 [Annulohypoxylon moriforme]